MINAFVKEALDSLEERLTRTAEGASDEYMVKLEEEEYAKAEAPGSVIVVRKADKKPVLNIDLWQELLPLLDKHRVEFIWVKGHNGHKYNEICDKLAVAEYQKHL